MKILIADDHPIVRRGLRDFLAEQFRDATFGEAGDAKHTLDFIERQAWDVALVDISMPGASGLDLLQQLKSRCPHMPVLVLSAYPEDQFGPRVLQAGAAGYMNKESAPEHLVTAIRKAMAGGRYVSSTLAEKLASRMDATYHGAPHESLSDREFQVLRLIASGRSVSEIAAELSLSVKTVSTYRSRVLEKMDMKNNAELTQYAIREGLV